MNLLKSHMKPEEFSKQSKKEMNQYKILTFFANILMTTSYPTIDYFAFKQILVVYRKISL